MQSQSNPVHLLAKKNLINFSGHSGQQTAVWMVTQSTTLGFVGNVHNSSNCQGKKSFDNEIDTFDFCVSWCYTINYGWKNPIFHASDA